MPPLLFISPGAQLTSAKSAGHFINPTGSFFATLTHRVKMRLAKFASASATPPGPHDWIWKYLQGASSYASSSKSSYSYPPIPLPFAILASPGIYSIIERQQSKTAKTLAKFKTPSVKKRNLYSIGYVASFASLELSKKSYFSF